MNSMKELDILKDMLLYKTNSQLMYNKGMITVRNPEIVEVFSQLRDDEMRDIVKLQQKIERQRNKKGIIAKIIPAKNRY